MEDLNTRHLPFTSFREVELYECPVGPDVESRAEFLSFCNSLKIRQQYGVGLEDLWVPEGMPYLDIWRDGADEVKFVVGVSQF